MIATLRKKHGEYFITIGLEIHVALQTKEKLFSTTHNEFDVSELALLDAGTPGILPVLSKEPVEMAIAFGLAVDADIQKESYFERKHYFYPDLPLGYQITQQHHPILIGGKVKIGEDRYIKIEHAHLECDAAKSIHDLYAQYSAIDLSRCASALLEIVSDPCIYSPEEAKEYAKQIHSLVTFMGICDGKLEEGSFRVDASISLSKTEKLGTRVEIKNISSFAFLQAALEYEIERQSELLDKGLTVDMETRLFHEKEMATYSMRKKETVDEYRYMPDPDIAPLIFDDKLIQETQSQFITTYFSLKEQLVSLMKSFNIIMKEEEIAALLSSPLKKQWLLLLKDKELQQEKVIRMLAFWLPDVYVKFNSERELGKEELLILGKSSLEAKECKETITKWLKSTHSIKDCMPLFISADEIKETALKVLSSYEEQKLKYKQGEIKMAQFLMGKVMSELKGKAPASDIKKMVEELLNQ